MLTVQDELKCNKIKIEIINRLSVWESRGNSAFHSAQFLFKDVPITVLMYNCPATNTRGARYWGCKIVCDMLGLIFEGDDRDQGSYAAMYPGVIFSDDSIAYAIKQIVTAVKQLQQNM